MLDVVPPTATAWEIGWITRGLGIPSQVHGNALYRLPGAKRDGDLADAYHRLLINTDRVIQGFLRRTASGLPNETNNSMPAKVSL